MLTKKKKKKKKNDIYRTARLFVCVLYVCMLQVF